MWDITISYLIHNTGLVEFLYTKKINHKTVKFFYLGSQ